MFFGFKADQDPDPDRSALVRLLRSHDQHWDKKLNSDPHWNQCGSPTLLFTHVQEDGGEPGGPRGREDPPLLPLRWRESYHSDVSHLRPLDGKLVCYHRTHTYLPSTYLTHLSYPIPSYSDLDPFHKIRIQVQTFGEIRISEKLQLIHS